MFRGNKIYIINKNGKRKRFWGIILGLHISFKGKNSVVELYEPIPKFSRSKIKIKDNSFVSIQSSKHRIKKLEILGESNQIFKIGKNFSNLNSCSLVSASESNLKISIGDNCMFSSNITIRASDGHTILNKATGQILNYGKDITIGNNVWIAGNVMVLKGVNIHDNTVIGHGSIVTKDCDSNSVYVGSPARKVKSNIIWDREAPYYIQ